MLHRSFCGGDSTVAQQSVPITIETHQSSIQLHMSALEFEDQGISDKEFERDHESEKDIRIEGGCQHMAHNTLPDHVQNLSLSPVLCTVVLST